SITQHVLQLKDGVKLSVKFRSHRNPILPGLVILLHGRLDHSKKGTCCELEKKLSYSTLSYDAQGMGTSTGNTGWVNIDEEVDDLKQVVNYIKTTFEPPNNKVLAIIGHSKGGEVCFKYGSTPSFKNQISQPNLYDIPLLVSISARYNLSQTGLSRFTSQQKEQLKRGGSFIWLRYWAGLDNQERREFLVTSKDIEISQSFNMDFVKDLSNGVQVLLLHVRADGTVSYREAQKFDDQIRKNCQNTSVDLILADGVQHNWDQAGEIDLMADWVNPWIKHRAGKDSKRVPDHLLSDHL
ncbi:Alpha/Beta hydrolase protein, partial [Phakopsora pachyrhizi]